MPTAAEINQLAWMREQLARRRFRNWQLAVHQDRDDQVTELTVRYQEMCSRDPYCDARVRVVRRIGPYTGLDVDRFHADVTRVLKGIWDHEFDEYNQLDGVPIVDPHADPTRWHCDCGGLGPVKHGGSWTCPGCGKEHTA